MTQTCDFRIVEPNHGRRRQGTYPVCPGVVTTTFLKVPFFKVTRARLLPHKSMSGLWTQEVSHCCGLLQARKGTDQGEWSSPGARPA